MSIIKNFKEKKCKSTACSLLQLLIFNKMLHILIGVGALILGSVGYSFTQDGSVINDAFIIITQIGAGILSIYAVVFLLFAWVINPIRELME